MSKCLIIINASAFDQCTDSTHRFLNGNKAESINIIIMASSQNITSFKDYLQTLAEINNDQIKIVTMGTNDNLCNRTEITNQYLPQQLVLMDNTTQNLEYAKEQGIDVISITDNGDHWQQAYQRFNRPACSIQLKSMSLSKLWQRRQHPPNDQKTIAHDNIDRKKAQTPLKC